MPVSKVGCFFGPLEADWKEVFKSGCWCLGESGCCHSGKLQTLDVWTVPDPVSESEAINRLGHFP